VNQRLQWARVNHADECAVAIQVGILSGKPGQAGSKNRPICSKCSNQESAGQGRVQHVMSVRQLQKDGSLYCSPVSMTQMSVPLPSRLGYLAANRDKPVVSTDNVAA
jgi:hypothetical protein